MSVYEELNKIMESLRDDISVAKNSAARTEESAADLLATARALWAQVVAYQNTLDRLSNIEMPK